MIEQREAILAGVSLGIKAINSNKYLDQMQDEARQPLLGAQSGRVKNVIIVNDKGRIEDSLDSNQNPQVNADGSAWTRFKTDHFKVADIVGRAVIVHALADNFGNVPVGSGATQYVPNSTGTTNATATGLTANTGNAGPRYACGVIESGD